MLLLLLLMWAQTVVLGRDAALRCAEVVENEKV